MKRVIKSSEDSSFVPVIDFEFGERLIESLRDKLTQKLRRRYKNLAIDFDDMRMNESRIVVEVYIYNNGALKTSGEFDFAAWSDYWDESDFQSHLDRKIAEFVNAF